MPKAPQPRTEWKVKSDGVRKGGRVGSRREAGFGMDDGHFVGDDGGARRPGVCLEGEEGMGVAFCKAVRSKRVRGSI